MGVHFRLEDNMLGVCLECGTMVLNGEEGCVTYSMEVLEELQAAGLPKNVSQKMKEAYMLQHFEYYNINEKQAIELLAKLMYFIKTNKVKKAVDDDALQAVVDDIFFYLRKTLSSTTFDQIQRTEDKEMQKSLALQYIQDIVSGYSEYDEVLVKLI